MTTTTPPTLTQAILDAITGNPHPCALDRIDVWHNLDIYVCTCGHMYNAVGYAAHTGGQA